MKVITMLHEKKGGTMGDIRKNPLNFSHTNKHWFGLDYKCNEITCKMIFLGWVQQPQISCYTFITQILQGFGLPTQMPHACLRSQLLHKRW